MASRKPRPLYLIMPSRQWMHRATLLLLVTAGLMLFVMGKSNNPVAEKLKTSLMDVVTPILSVAASPFNAVNDIGIWLKDMAALRQENIALKNENLQLLKWQAAAKSMEAENKSLKTLLNVVPADTHAYVTARIVSDIGGPYVQSALISGGTEDGIGKNQAVVHADGLVGRTLEVGKSSSRVLLLNDINSRVPVMGEKTREKSILSGNNTRLPTLAYIPANSKITEGERIVTSGDGGVFPPGIPVGKVEKIEKGEVSIRLFVDPSSIEYVSTIDYSF